MTVARRPQRAVRVVHGVTVDALEDLIGATKELCLQQRAPAQQCCMLCQCISTSVQSQLLSCTAHTHLAHYHLPCVSL